MDISRSRTLQRENDGVEHQLVIRVDGRLVHSIPFGRSITSPKLPWGGAEERSTSARSCRPSRELLTAAEALDPLQHRTRR